MSYRRRDRDHRGEWPHFDSRGPEYYYDEPPRPRYREFEDPYGRPGNSRQSQSGIYEDEFVHGRDWDDGRQYRGENYGRWPEDEFYDNRRDLGYGDNFIERGAERLRSAWNRWAGRGPEYHGRFPEDHQRYYGRDTHGYNANRGGPEERRYRPRHEAHRYF